MARVTFVETQGDASTTRTLGGAGPGLAICNERFLGWGGPQFALAPPRGMTRATSGQNSTVRVATFNILNGRTPTESVVDEARYADAIASLDADVLALQEVDRNQPRSGGADLTALAAGAMGAVDHRFEPVLRGLPGDWVPASGGEMPGVPAYGIALLSRYPVLRWETFRLPRLKARSPYLLTDQGRLVWVREEPRAVLLAELDTPLARVRVLTTHLSFLPWCNGHQLRALARRVGQSEVPTVVVGDLNLRPRRAARATGMRPAARGLTFPTNNPTVQLDHILVTSGLHAVSGGAVPLPVSDHRALVADLEHAPAHR